MRSTAQTIDAGKAAHATAYALNLMVQRVNNV